MDMIPRNDYGERCQFDAYCKLVLYHEAIDYLREMQRRRDRELSFSDLPQMEMDKLCVVDHYPSDRFTFSSHGYDLHIENELVADAFAGLSCSGAEYFDPAFCSGPAGSGGWPPCWNVSQRRSAAKGKIIDRAADQVGRTHAEGRLKV